MWNASRATFHPIAVSCGGSQRRWTWECTRLRGEQWRTKKRASAETWLKGGVEQEKQRKMSHWLLQYLMMTPPLHVNTSSHIICWQWCCHGYLPYQICTVQAVTIPSLLFSSFPRRGECLEQTVPCKMCAAPRSCFSVLTYVVWYVWRTAWKDTPEVWAWAKRNNICMKDYHELMVAHLFIHYKLPEWISSC